MVAQRACRTCRRSVDVDELGFSFCRDCKSWDATSCFHCGTAAGFPVIAPYITVEDAEKVSSGSSLEARLDRERLLRKSLIYCRRCFHEAYFVVQNGDESRCQLCDTTWNRLGPAVHTDEWKTS